MSRRPDRRTRQLARDDHRALWHPFTQMQDWRREEPLIIERGRGCYLIDTQGRAYLDGVSSIWCNLHGHRKRAIDQAIKKQLDRLAHSTLLGLANVPSIGLARQLVRLSPRGLNKVFYSDDGSTAMEIALKMAFQYWRHRGVKSKRTFLTLENAYHGDTIGAVSAGGVETFHAAFRPLLFKTFQAPSPYCYRCPLGRKRSTCRMACLKAMASILRRHHRQIAAVVVEPLVQGAGGMIVAPKGYLRGVRRLCDQHDVLLVCDEVAVGFGRTGKMFACEHERVRPDLMALAKGITGGYLPLAATLTTDAVCEAFLGDYAEQKTFFHGHTYTGNPLACAAALANLEVFRKERTLQKLQPKIRELTELLKPIRRRKHVGDVRQCGFIAGIELVRDRKSREPYDWKERLGIRVCRKARERNVIIRPLGNVIVVMPPLAMTIPQLRKLIRVIDWSIAAITEHE